MKYLLFSLFVFGLVLLYPCESMAQGFTVLEPTGKWVTDAGDMLSDSEERWLSQKLAAYEDTTSTQIVIVTLPDMNGVPASEYAIELGRQWRVGQQGQDNGIVILASRNDRKLFIATGYGLEGAIPDAIASRIIQNIIVPNFRQGNFYNGFSSATDALINAARGEYSASPQDRGVPIDIDTIITLIFIAVFLYSVISRGGGSSGGRHHRRRGDFPVILWGPTFGGGSSGGFGGGGFGGGGFGGFGGGGGSFGGGGAGGGW